MGFLGNFFDSGLFQNVIFPLIVLVVVFYVLSWMMFKKAPGTVVMEFMGNRPIKIDDLDAQVHARILDACEKECKLSDNKNVRYLWLESTDRHQFTHEGGRKFVGHVKGFSETQSYVMVKFKKSFWTYRKFYFVAPPELLISNSSARNIIFEGTSIKNTISAVDFCYPSPSKAFKAFNENEMDWWSYHDFYETKRQMASIMMFTQLGETTGLQSASSTAQEKLFKDALRTHQFRQEAAPVEDTAQEPSWIAE
jgi:hypothetical protein